MAAASGFGVEFELDCSAFAKLIVRVRLSCFDYSVSAIPIDQAATDHWSRWTLLTADSFWLALHLEAASQIDQAEKNQCLGCLESATGIVRELEQIRLESATQIVQVPEPIRLESAIQTVQVPEPIHSESATQTVRGLGRIHQESAIPIDQADKTLEKHQSASLRVRTTP